jgi:ribonuclease BN (tRNA processing enzyme)
MEIIVLGSGTILSGPSRMSAGYLLRRGNSVLLLDCGPGILFRLKAAQIELLSIETALLSHFHLDHCNDLFPILMNRALLRNGANEKLQIIGPNGLQSWFRTVASTQGAWLTAALPQILQVGDAGFEWAGVTVTACPTGHTLNSISYKFNTKQSLFYSGDAGPNNELANFARGAHTGILECSHPDERPQPGHMTPVMASQFAARAGFSRLILTHFYPENDPPRFGKEVRQIFDGEIVIAEDMLHIGLDD